MNKKLKNYFLKFKNNLLWEFLKKSLLNKFIMEENELNYYHSIFLFN